MKIKLIKKFYKFGYLWWSWWSRIYRTLYHSRYSSIVLEAHLTLTEVEDNLKKLTWAPDTWKELWDACGDPGRVQHELNQINFGFSNPQTQMDCDDFAIWASHAIDRNFYPRIFTFSWLTEDNKIRGHAMCLCLQEDGRIFHIGNWDTSPPFNNLREMCEDILVQTGAKEAICWGLFDKDLKLLESGPELPSEKIS